ncbi:MAG: flagellar hook-length control protein FliK [Burkholderiaceae bacterium]|nr:flagellar hook-length control protein FliK [Burkholderiaceae bacterium]
MTMSSASARGSGEARAPMDALTASTSARRAAGEDRRSVEGRNGPVGPREGFDATMSRALQQARRDAAGHKGEGKGDCTQATGPSASRPGAEPARNAATQDGAARAAEGKEPAEDRSGRGDDDETRTDDSNDTVAALLASVDAAANGAPPIAAASASSVESATPLATQADAAAALADASDARAPAAGKDPVSGAASPDGGANAQQHGAAFAAAAPGRRKIGADTDAGPATTAGTDDATHASSTGADAASDSAAAAASSKASPTDSATHRTSLDFAVQLAQARSAPAHVAPFADASRNAAAPPAAAPAAQAGVVSTPLHAAAFPAHFAAEVAVLGAAGIERAEIQLQPPELGPVRIELSLSGESTRVAFSAAQPETRQAIEQSLPILKELLAERGLMLGNASVSDGDGHTGFGANGSAGSSAGGAAARDAGGNAADGRTLAGDTRRAALRRSLLDVYA